MRKQEHIVRYTAEELAKMGPGRSNWKKAAAMTEEELQKSIAADPDEAGFVVDWSTVTTELPQPKVELHMRIDRDVIAFFRKMGKGYQTRINAVLRSYMSQVKSNGPKRAKRRA